MSARKSGDLTPSSPVRSIPDAWASALLLLLAMLCALFLLWLPRPVHPGEPPGLRLPLPEVKQALQRDREAAAAPLPRDEAARLERLYRQQGRFERLPARPPEARRELDELRDRLRLLREQRGEAAVDALRARAAAALRPALQAELSEEQTQAILGSFPRTLEMYGASRQGELVAPWFVVRTMYKARWNLVHAFAPTRGMQRVEQLAYYGWLALQADGAPLHKRMNALGFYAALQGSGAAEAQGVLSFQIGGLASAERHLRAAYRQRPGWRLRNNLLAVSRLRGAKEP